MARAAFLGLIGIVGEPHKNPAGRDAFWRLTEWSRHPIVQQCRDEIRLTADRSTKVLQTFVGRICGDESSPGSSFLRVPAQPPVHRVHVSWKGAHVRTGIRI